MRNIRHDIDPKRIRPNDFVAQVKQAQSPATKRIFAEIKK
jgi:hypothetical protein